MFEDVLGHEFKGFDGNEKINGDEYKVLNELAEDSSKLEKIDHEKLKEMKTMLELQLKGYLAREGVSNGSKEYIKSLTERILSKIDDILNSEPERKFRHIQDEPEIVTIDLTKKQEQGNNQEGEVSENKKEASDASNTNTGDSSVVNVASSKGGVNNSTETNHTDSLGDNIRDDDYGDILGGANEIESNETNKHQNQEQTSEEAEDNKEGEGNFVDFNVPEEILKGLGIENVSVFSGIEITEDASKQLEEVIKLYSEGNKEQAKSIFVSILSNESNIKDSDYDIKKSEIESELAKLDSSEFKVSSFEGLESIDDIKSYIVENINNQLNSTKIKVDGEEKSLAEYLVDVKASFEARVTNNNIELQNSSLNKKVEEKITEIIKSSLPNGADLSKVDFSIKVDDGIFSDSVELSRFTSKNKDESIDKVLNFREIDLTGEILPSIIGEIKDDEIYKVKVAEDKYSYVKGSELKSFLEEQQGYYIDNKRDELSSRLEGLNKEHEEKLQSVKKTAESIKPDEKSLDLEKLGFSGLVLDGKTPDISYNEDKRIYELSVLSKGSTEVDDTLNEGGADYNNFYIRLDNDGNKYIKDEESILPEVSVSNSNDIAKYYEIYNYGKEKGDEVLKQFSGIRTIGELEEKYNNLTNEERKLEEERKAKEEKEKTFETKKEELDKYLENVKISKELLASLGVDDTYLSEFRDSVELDVNSIEKEGDNVVLNIDIDNDGFNKDYNSDIKIIIPAEKFNTIKNEDIKNYIAYEIIPKIAKELQKDNKETWENEKIKTFRFGEKTSLDSTVNQEVDASNLLDIKPGSEGYYISKNFDDLLKKGLAQELSNGVYKFHLNGKDFYAKHYPDTKAGLSFARDLAQQDIKEAVSKDTDSTVNTIGVVANNVGNKVLVMG